MSKGKAWTAWKRWALRQYGSGASQSRATKRNCQTLAVPAFFPARSDRHISDSAIAVMALVEPSTFDYRRTAQTSLMIPYKEQVVLSTYMQIAPGQLFQQLLRDLGHRARRYL